MAFQDDLFLLIQRADSGGSREAEAGGFSGRQPF
jgi:hypothetical protein